MKKDLVNKYGIKLSEIKIGIRVETEDGDNGILERISSNPFPYYQISKWISLDKFLNDQENH